MSSTTNKSINTPAHGSFDDSWDVPINANWAIIDNALGGFVEVNVTGVTGSTQLSLAQYTPPNIVFIGTLSENISYAFPDNVGGIWTVWNATTGSFTLTLANDVGGGRGVLLTQSQRTLVVSDGTNVDAALFVPTTLAFSQLTGSIENAQVPELAVTQWQLGLSINAVQLYAGTVPLARLPLPATMTGITIAADPGTTPSGTYGDIFYYY